MKYLNIIALVFLGFMNSALAETKTISIQGFSYSPDQLVINVGDTVEIEASSSHPLVQVDAQTWDLNRNTSMPDGWGVQTSNYRYVATQPDTIYFVCQIHSGLGMKGSIIVEQKTGIKDFFIHTPNIKLSPNPVSSNSNLLIQTTEIEIIKIEIFNSNGNSVKKIVPVTNNISNNFNYNINLQDLLSGLYFLKISSIDGQYIDKFLILN
jgi:plastocyanin